MPLDQLRMIAFDRTAEAYILMRVWEELGGPPPLVTSTGEGFADALRDVRPDEGVVVMSHGGVRRWQYTDEAGESLLYKNVPVIQGRVVFGFSCFQGVRSPLRKARTALVCRRWAYNTDLVALLFALARADDPFDADAVQRSYPALPSTWEVHRTAA